ncbi:MAG: PD-(D/E)XK nuclease family protein, partial [Sedimentisphaerales bacterium]|nr:PD-(D/E)XK nuclease family protein [Sedimentisphaerales bacterium]
IIALCRDGGLRFNQIAIIARDLTGREETIAATLEEYNIPYFMDANRPVNHHPLIKLVRSAFELLTDNFRIDAIFDYIKTDLAPLTRPEADTLENYCITTGVFGSSWLSPDPWHCQTREYQKGPQKNTFQSSLEEIDQLRRQAIAPLLKMKNNIAAAGKEPGVKVITRSLMELLDDLEVTRKLAQWQQNADQEGDLEEQQVHSQIYSDFIDILNELVGALDNFPLTLREYSDILFAALSQMSLRLVPPCLDQVLVGTIERSRQPEIKAAFILGMNDGIFPKHTSSTAIITDRQRDILSASNFELAPAAGIKLLQEKYLAYIAFTRASQYLWVSYCSSDSSDRILNESPFIKDLKSSCGKETVTVLSDSRSSSSPDRVTNQEQLAMELTAALADMRDNGQPEPFWQMLYQQAGPDILPEIAKEGLKSTNKAELSPEMAKEIAGNDHMETSISKLEEYSRCPFRFFSKYMLKLNERKPFGLQAVDMGSYYHAVLCEEFRILQNRGQNWHEIENEQLPQLVEDASQEVCRHNPEVIELIEKTSRNSYMFAKARQDLVKLSLTICQAARVSNFRQEQAEFGFGGQQDQTTGLHLTLPDAYKVILTGKIDRIDTWCQQGQNKAVAIYDYKLSDKKFDWVKFYSGLELQLACYLLIAAEQYQGGNNQPAGMFFLETRPATIRYNTPMPQNKDSSEPQINSAGVKYNGLVNSDYALNLETNLESGSQFYSGLKKPKSGDNAGIIAGPNCVSDETIKAVMSYSRNILTDIANNIITGKIEILPYRYKMETACTNCPYDQVCRFDQSLDQYREIIPCDAESIKDLITRKNI